LGQCYGGGWRERVIHIAHGENVVYYRFVEKNIVTVWNAYQKPISTVHRRFLISSFFKKTLKPIAMSTIYVPLPCSYNSTNHRL
jgi:hypothetical protein